MAHESTNRVLFNLFFLIGGLGVIVIIIQHIVILDLYHTDFLLFCTAVFVNCFMGLGTGLILHETIQECKKIK